MGKEPTVHVTASLECTQGLLGISFDTTTQGATVKSEGDKQSHSQFGQVQHTVAGSVLQIEIVARDEGVACKRVPTSE